MTQIFNKHEELEKRRRLRNNATTAEKILWTYLRKRQVADIRFLRQFSINKFVLDFYAPKLRLAIELDGSIHFDTAEIIEYDKQRQSYIEKLGIIFLRFNNEEVFNNCDSVVEKIKQTVGNIIQNTKSEPPLTPPFVNGEDF